MFTSVLQFNALIRCWGQRWWHSLVLWRTIFVHPKIITAWFVKVVFCDTVSVKAAHPPRTPTAATGDSRGVGYFSIVVLNNNGTPRMMLLFYFFFKQQTLALKTAHSLFDKVVFIKDYLLLLISFFLFITWHRHGPLPHPTPSADPQLWHEYTNQQPCCLSCAFSRWFYSAPPSRRQQSDLIIPDVYHCLPQPRASGEICLLPLSVMSCQCTAS